MNKKTIVLSLYFLKLISDCNERIQRIGENSVVHPLFLICSKI